MPKKTTKSAAARRTTRSPKKTTPVLKATGRRRRTGKASPKQPFSLILEPTELNALKKMAQDRNTSVASIIRQALHTVIFRADPDLAKATIENEVNTFLDHVGSRLPIGQKGAKRAQLRKQMISGLLEGIGSH